MARRAWTTSRSRCCAAWKSNDLLGALRHGLLETRSRPFETQSCQRDAERRGPLPHSARTARQNNVMGEGPRFAAGQSKLLALDADWDKMLLDGFAAGDLSTLDSSDDQTISQTGGRGSHEVRCWIAALAALGQGYKSDVLFYEPIPEWLTGMGIMTATPA